MSAYYLTTCSINQDELDDKWLSKISVSNSFNKLQEVEVLPGNDRTERNNPQPKSPPIHIEAQVIAPLIDLLKEIAKDEYTLKQLKDNHVKQVNTSDTYRKVTKPIKEKKANFYTYQSKKDRSYKVVLRGMHSRTDAGIIIDELKKKEPLGNSYSKNSPKVRHKLALENFNSPNKITSANFSNNSFEGPQLYPRTSNRTCVDVIRPWETLITNVNNFTESEIKNLIITGKNSEVISNMLI
uniref:Uncharacterized protein n=1 Tax=Vespula pensylvanica TaxID=30213 RepID=A0A834U4M2_VESPE|nr:hypothetical protein H0235_012586 [Vespula pensylvanica]